MTGWGFSEQPYLLFCCFPFHFKVKNASSEKNKTSGTRNPLAADY
jgi:hypothetical protein